MNPHYGKSRFVRQKQSTKSSIEDNTPEEEQLKKYREIIERLEGEFKNKSGKVKISSLYSSSMMNTAGASKGNNKSSYMRRTTSRTKEVLNDRDFLINFMNNDSMPILPKNMHLLSDNDTNQSISDETKYKNLADLMIDDRETVVESHFTKNVDDKMILKLYTALSRKSKDVFMDEDHEEQSKNRIFLQKLNDINIPEHEIYDPSLNDKNENSENILNESNDSYQDNENLSSKRSNNNINNKNTKSILKKKENNTLDDKDEEEKKEEENKFEFNKDCKYNKKNKNNTIKIPTLEPYNPYLDKYHSRRFHKNRPKNLWDPEIDGDFLAYINHNIISIEDIYNQGKIKSLNISNSREDEIKPIEAKEIFFDNPNNQNKSEYNTNNDNDKEYKNKSVDDNSQKKDLSNIEEEENEIRTKNKFCEFKDRHPNLIEISLLVDPTKQKINVFHNELKDIYYSKINEVGEFAEDIFPPKGIDLKSLKIYRYALNNERNEEESIERFTILSTKKSTPASTPKNQKIEKESTKRKKTMFNIYNNRKISEDNFVNKKNKENSNGNLNINFSALLKRENDKDNEIEIENKNEEENNIQNIQNNIDNNFSLNEKESQNMEDNSIDKKSLSDNLNKIFNSGSFKSNNEENTNNINNTNNENNINNISNQNNKNNISNENDKNKENSKSESSKIIDENNIENQNEISLKLNEKKFNSNSNLSNENLYHPDNKDNFLKLSFSRNSGD